MSQSLVNKWNHLLLPILNTALAELGDVPSLEIDPAHRRADCKGTTQSQEGEFFHDGIERPIQCPKDHKLKRLILAMV